MGRHSYDPGQEPRPTPRLRVAHGGLTDIGLLRAVNGSPLTGIFCKFGSEDEILPVAVCT